jgi:replicative DNA helicase
MQNIQQFTEGEKAILGACLLDNKCLPAVMDVVDASCFYNTAHAIVFAAICDLHRKNNPADWVTLTSTLKKTGQLESVGGQQFLVDLADAVPSIANVQHYAEKVREKAELRQAISFAREVITTASAADAESAAVNALLQKAAFDCALKGRGRRPFYHIREVLGEAISNLDNPNRGIKTGFVDLDAMTAGFQRSDLIMIAARPSMGKTAFALDFLSFATKGELAVIFSLEMNRMQLAQRIMARNSGVNLLKIRSGRLTQEDKDTIITSVGDISDHSFIIDDSPRVSVEHMKSRIREVSVKYNRPVSLVVTDYLTRMHVTEKFSSDHQKYGSITKGLKDLALEFDIPVACLAQLSRKVTGRPFLEKDGRYGRLPNEADIRESGSIEEDADVIIGLYRPERDAPKPVDQKYLGKGSLLVLKQRNGPTGEINLRWDAQTTTFSNAAPEYRDEHEDPTASRYDHEPSMSIL